nr:MULTISPECIES: methyl-accepting chemotaxis protein [unclassified Pseudomonas]
MQQTLRNGFNNLSVRTKLSLGFSLLVAMILLVAYTGWQAALNLAERSDRLRDIAGVSTMIRDMRIERLVYYVTPSDEQAVKWGAALDKIEAHAQSISPHFDSPQNMALIGEVNDLLKRYRPLYQQAVASTRERETARKAALVSAQNLNTLLQKLSGEAEAGGAQERQQINALAFDVQKTQMTLRDYIAAPTKDAATAASAAVANVSTAIAALKPGAWAGATAQQLVAEAAHYKESVGQAIQAQTSVEAAQSNVTATITRLLALTIELTDIQASLQKVDISDAIQALLIWLTVAIGIGLVAAWMITRSIVVPLKQTVEMAETVAKGDFTHRQEVTRTDELGALQSSMQRMTVNLHGLVSQLKDGVVQVASAAEQLSAVTEQTSAGVQSQKVETDQIATAMQEMAATTHEVARNAGQAATCALDASRRAGEGDQAVNKAVSQIEQLAEEMAAAKAVMTTLRGHADSIGGVVDVIKSVSEQTNLLALNAAIEAARAGDAGRGFAVVADEVRGLAQRTRTSTEEIGQLIARLNQSTDHMATVLEQNAALTDSSVERSREVGQMLKQIAGSVKDIESMNEQIACAAEQQSAAGEQITRSVTNVRDISDQTAAASEETASSSAELARIGVQLQALAGQFKV